jgi:mRNA-degrading endonuclease RelE of RelBE toxin-antitoxin system
MVDITFHPRFRKAISKIKDNKLKQKIFKQFSKIKNNPEVGKPMKYSRKGTREVYVPPFRLSYEFIKQENRIFFKDLYHKKKQ